MRQIGASFLLLLITSLLPLSCMDKKGHKVIWFNKISAANEPISASVLSLEIYSLTDSTENWTIKYSEDSVAQLTMAYSQKGVSLCKSDTLQLILPYTDTVIDSDCKMIYPFVFDKISYMGRKIFHIGSVDFEVVKISGIANSHYGHIIYYLRNFGPIAVRLNDDSLLVAQLLPKDETISLIVDSLLADSAFQIECQVPPLPDFE